MKLATSLQSLHLSLPFSGNLMCRKSKKRVPNSVCARKRDANSHDKGHDHVRGRLVDENMIVLRMRIQEMKMKEEEEQQNHVTKSGKYWMEWEREWCKNYESDVVEGVGFLQTWMMNSRPSMVLGMVALLIFSVSTSLAVALCYLLDFVMGLHFSGF
ncbi:hypothetical protein Pfo_009764 [Paulownia fortunei]|nr:hypothetical protein Pfo_009764 [Paulownia fortunei]